MPLTEQQANGLLNAAGKTAGCPVNVSDRLEAFKAGMATMAQAIMPHVSLDVPPPEPPPLPTPPPDNPDTPEDD